MIDYLVGNYRYYLYNSRVSFLLRKHIKEQYEWRLTLANPKCLNNGECIMCGCKTPNLLMANKACEGECYYKFLNKKNWNRLKILPYEIEWEKKDGTMKRVNCVNCGNKSKRSTREY